MLMRVVTTLHLFHPWGAPPHPGPLPQGGEGSLRVGALRQGGEGSLREREGGSAALPKKGRKAARLELRHPSGERQMAFGRAGFISRGILPLLLDSLCLWCVLPEPRDGGCSFEAEKSLVN